MASMEHMEQQQMVKVEYRSGYWTLVVDGKGVLSTPIQDRQQAEEHFSDLLRQP
jgi:hypothetical protein